MIRLKRMVMIGAAVAMVSLMPLGARQPVLTDAEATARAKQLFEFLREGKVDEFSKDFNAQMIAAFPPDKVRGVIADVQQQAGAFQSFIEEKVQRQPSSGHTAVIFGCQYEKAGVNVMFVFDADSKLAGFAFRPRRP